MIRAPINTISVNTRYVNQWLISAKKLFGGWTEDSKPIRPRKYKQTDNIYKIVVDPDNGKEYMKCIPWWKSFSRVSDIDKNSPIIDKWLKYKEVIQIFYLI